MVIRCGKDWTVCWVREKLEFSFRIASTVTAAI
jgi:hypothetical protein